MCFGQQNKIDSLLTLLKTDGRDTNKVNHLNKLSQEYLKISSYDSTFRYSNTALQLAEKLNFKKGIAFAFNNIGRIHTNRGNYSEALKNHFAALKITEELKNMQGVASSYNNIGRIYTQQGNYLEALKSFEASLKMYEVIKDKNGIATSINNIGYIHKIQDNYPEALKHFEASLTLYEEIGDKSGIATSYGNIGNIYWHQGNYTVALKNHLASLKINEGIKDKQGVADSYNNIGLIYANQGNYHDALINYSTSLKIYQELKDKNGIAASYNNVAIVYTNQRNLPLALKNFFSALKIREETQYKEGIAASYNNIGIIYHEQKMYPEALEFQFKALKILEEIGDKSSIALTYCSIGNVFTKQNKFKLAEEYLIKAKKLAGAIGYKQYIKDAYNGLMLLDSTKGDFKSTFENHKMYILYRDSIDNEETRKKTIQQSMTYDFEKKEIANQAIQDKKNAIAEEAKQKQKIITYSVSIGLLLVLLLALFIFRGLRQKQKANFIITEQKIEVENQKHLIEEKHKEITDSINYAERIQRSFLATSQLLTENLNEYFVFFQPKDVVSGDFYWAAKLNNGNFILATADSTGHGVPGAIMSILNIACLENSVKDGLLEPSEILNNTRTNIIDRLKKDGSLDGGKDGMDCSLISFDYKNNKLTYAAANNPIWIVRENQILEFAPDKMPVGKHDKDSLSFTQHIISLQKDDVVYALTDGFPDQFGGPKGKKFKYKTLKELLISTAHLPMHEQKETLQKTLNNWKGDLEQVDDICLIGVRI